MHALSHEASRPGCCRADIVGEAARYAVGVVDGGEAATHVSSFAERCDITSVASTSRLAILTVTAPEPSVSLASGRPHASAALCPSHAD